MTDAAGRPTEILPKRELLRLSIYWLGLSSIFAGLDLILGARILFDGLGDEAFAGRTLLTLTIWGTIIAVIVQPTVGSISDYTISRWGRRKPYIVAGTPIAAQNAEYYEFVPLENLERQFVRLPRRGAVHVFPEQVTDLRPARSPRLRVADSTHRSCQRIRQFD